MLTGKVEFGSPEKIDIGIIFLTFKLTLYYVVSVLMYIFHMNSFFFLTNWIAYSLTLKKKKKESWEFSCGSVVTNPTSVSEDVGSIPVLTQWVKDPVWHGCGVGRQQQLRFDP